MKEPALAIIKDLCFIRGFHS